MEKDGFREYIMSKESVLVDSDMFWRSFDDRQRVTPLDLMKIRRENPDLFFSKYFGNNLKHKPMKKYRVVTDNLDWVGIPKDSIIEEIVPSMYAFYTGSESKSLIGSKEMGYALFSRPEWFQEIKEDEVDDYGYKPIYSEKDILNFGDHAISNYQDYDEEKLGGRKWLVRKLLHDFKALNISPKEEPKEYTEFDMRESFNAGINRGNYLTE